MGILNSSESIHHGIFHFSSFLILCKQSTLLKKFPVWKSKRKMSAQKVIKRSSGDDDASNNQPASFKLLGLACALIVSALPGCKAIYMRPCYVVFFVHCPIITNYYSELFTIAALKILH